LDQLLANQKDDRDLFKKIETCPLETQHAKSQARVQKLTKAQAA
jgi:hypothetical protein